jgi:hypothetical protein
VDHRKIPPDPALWQPTIFSTNGPIRSEAFWGLVELPLRRYSVWAEGFMLYPSP